MLVDLECATYCVEWRIHTCSKRYFTRFTPIRSSTFTGPRSLQTVSPIFLRSRAVDFQWDVSGSIKSGLEAAAFITHGLIDSNVAGQTVVDKLALYYEASEDNELRKHSRPIQCDDLLA